MDKDAHARGVRKPDIGLANIMDDLKSDPFPTFPLANDDDEMSARTAALVADFEAVHERKMRDAPLVNPALQVEAVGFRRLGTHYVGVLVTPWLMNLIVLPPTVADPESWETGRKEPVRFPSGDYEFLTNSRETVGGYKACSLFSPMSDFITQAQAVAVAEAVMEALIDPGQGESDALSSVLQLCQADRSRCHDATSSPHSGHG